METVKTSRFITEVAPTKLISPTREPFKNMLTTISEEDFDFEELVRATSERLSSSHPGFSPGLLVAKSILLSLSIYHNSGCYNSLTLKERNILVAPHDRSQDASQVSETANQL
ncbi:unnamed protein product [Brassica oleracea]